MAGVLSGRWLGQVEYREAFRVQEETAALVRGLDGGLHVALCLEHPPVFTLGKRGGLEFLHVTPEELARRGAQVVQTDRGGLITFHGPGQLIVYPVVHLERTGKTLSGYVELLLGACLETVTDFGLGSARIDMAHPGLWVGEKKLLSIGVRVTDGVTMHGIALNLGNDLSWFDCIDPCGMKVQMTSLGLETGRSPDSREAAAVLCGHLAARLAQNPGPFLVFA